MPCNGRCRSRSASELPLTIASRPSSRLRMRSSIGASAAVTAIAGAVFSGSNDGSLRAFSTTTGEMLWEFDSNRDFTTVNAVPAKGASMIGPGAVVAGGMVYVNSGYGAFGGRPGNVLLAFGPE